MMCDTKVNVYLKDFNETYIELRTDHLDKNDRHELLNILNEKDKEFIYIFGEIFARDQIARISFSDVTQKLVFI